MSTVSVQSSAPATPFVLGDGPSVSQASPVPSESVSSWRGLAVKGQLSVASGSPSLSSSVSQASPRPSLSLSSWPGLASSSQLSSQRALSPVVQGLSVVLPVRSPSSGMPSPSASRTSTTVSLSLLSLGSGSPTPAWLTARSAVKANEQEFGGSPPAQVTLQLSVSWTDTLRLREPLSWNAGLPLGVMSHSAVSATETSSV